MSAVTGNRKEKYTYTWAVENCAEIPSSIEKGKSRYFVTNVDGNVMHWQLSIAQQLCPPRHYLNFCLISRQPRADAHDNSMETGVTLSVHLKNERGQTATQQKRYTFNEKNYTAHPFGSYEYFTDLKKHFGFELARDGSLRGFSMTLICDIFFELPTACRDDGDAGAAMSVTSLTFEEPDEFDAGEDYLAGEADTCDVTIVAGGRELRAHKSVLSLHSKVLADMCADGVVRLEDASAEVTREILRFAYDGRIREAGRLAGGLFAAAEKYQMQGLKEFCEGELIREVSLTNFEKFIDIAHRHKAERLKKHMLQFLDKHL